MLAVNSWVIELDLSLGSIYELFARLSSNALGRVVGMEMNSPLVWIEDNGSIALVDVSVMLASDNSTVDLFRQPKSHIMVTGYIEELEVR